MERRQRQKRETERGEGRAERDVSREWAEETGAQRARRRWGGGGCDAFTEEALSGWRSPPLPRLSAQTQTAPEVEKMQGKKRDGKKESISVEQLRNAISE